MSEFHIRTANATDLPRLMGMEHATSSDYVWQLDLRKEPGQVTAALREVRLPRSVPVGYPRNPYALADDWKRAAGMLIALQGDQPVGYIRFREQASAGWVWVTDLVVAADVRRQGAATALLLSVQEWAAARKYRKIFVETIAKNYPAICFLRKNSYEFCGYNDQYYATQDVALFFGRTVK